MDMPFPSDMQTNGSLPAGNLPPGTIVAGFRIEREIGRGGMGVVYLATQLNLQRFTALKVLADELSGNSMFVQRFFQEAHSAACLSHSNIVQAYDAGISSGLCYFAMEYVNGETLDLRLNRDGALPARSVMELGARISCALGYAWNTRGMCHGDIKPDNILISTTGELKLADLGLAKSIYDEDFPRDVMVTPLYAPPEIISGRVTEPNLLSDIYSFGASLYHAATGAPPFNSEAIEVIYRRHLEETPRPPSFLNNDIPRPLSDLILKMIEKNPADRPSSWQEIEDACRNMLEESEPAVTISPPPEKKRKKLLWIIVFAALIPLLLFAGFFLSRLPFWKNSDQPSEKTSVLAPRISSLPDRKDDQSYLRTVESFCSAMRYAPFFDPEKTSAMLHSCRFLIRQGTLPHLAEARKTAEPELRIAEQILMLRSAAFTDLPRVSPRKTLRKKPVPKKIVRKKTLPPKRIDHRRILVGILTEFRSKPSVLRKKLVDFGKKYEKSAPIRSAQALWISEALTEPEELLSLFLGWSSDLKGLPISSGFRKPCEFYELDDDFLRLQYSEGIMRLRKKFPATSGNLLKVRSALMEAPAYPDFWKRMPNEIQRYVVIRFFFLDVKSGASMLRQLDPKLRKEMAQILAMIRESKKR